MKSLLLLPMFLPICLMAACTPPMKEMAKAEKEKIQTYEYMDTFGQITGIGTYVYTRETSANKRAMAACQQETHKRTLTIDENDNNPQYYTTCQKQ